MGIIYEKLNNYKNAISQFESILTNKDNGNKANYYLGTYYLNNNKYEQARMYLEKVLDFDQDEYKDDALLKIALCYEGEKNYQRAVTTLLKIKLLYPQSHYQDVVLLKIAEDYENLNDMNNALQFYKELYEQYKNSDYYQNAVERLLVYYLKTQDKKSAQSYYEELQKINKSKADKYKQYME